MKNVAAVVDNRCISMHHSVTKIHIQMGKPRRQETRDPKSWVFSFSVSHARYYANMLLCNGSELMLIQCSRNDIDKRNDNEEADWTYDHQAYGPATRCRYRRIFRH
jgi:hypothetical protein